MADLTAGRYAQALLRLCTEERCVDDVYRQVQAINAACENEAAFLQLIKHPEIHAEEKMSLLKSIFDGKVSDNLLGFFHVAVSKGRGGEIPGFLERFITLVDESRGVTTAYVTTAEPLSAARVLAVKAALSNRLNKLVEIKTEVDPALIGGIRIDVDGQVFDSTVKRQMAELKSTLLNMQLV